MKKYLLKKISKIIIFIILIYLALTLISYFAVALIYSFFVFEDIKNFWLALKETNVVSYTFALSTILLIGLCLTWIWFKYKDPKANKKMITKENKRKKAELLQVQKNELVLLNKNIGLVKNKLNQHTLLIGATGSGKTTTALLIVKQLIERLNQTVIIIDGKGDHDLIDKIKLIDSNAFIWTIGGIKEYNPLATDNSVILVDKIMSLFNFSEAHYEAIAHNYLLLIVKSLQNAKIPTTFHNIVKYFSLSSLKKIIKKDSIEYDHYLSFTNNEKDINGLMHRLSVYMQNLGTSVGENNSLSSLVNKHKIILFSLNSLNYPQLASNVGKLIVQDLKEFASLKPKEQRINLILDEFNVFASDTIINLINKTRSFNYQVFLCFQTLNDLKINRTNLTDTIFGNCGNIIAHNLKDPNSAEYIAKVFGTQTTDKQTKQTDKTEKTGKGSTREVEEYIVHPNELKNLKIGEAYCKILLPSSKQLIDKIIIKQ